jgi:N-acetylneuraminic acid mutarotase
MNRSVFYASFILAIGLIKAFAVSVTPPSARDYHTAVWTGTEMIVWGGVIPYLDGGDPYLDAGYYKLNTGGKYNPRTNAWIATSAIGAPTKRFNHTAVWTGTEMIIWGGHTGYTELDDPLNTGGRYNPKTNTWREISTVGAPTARDSHNAVWTGTEMIVLGGGDKWGNPISNGGRYNPRTNTWTEISTVGWPNLQYNFSAVWTGTEIIVFGGRYFLVDENTNTFGYLNTGGRYNPITNTWTEISTVGAPPASYDRSAVWTGKEMIVWGGKDGNRAGDLNVGGRYNPITNTWTEISTVGAPTARSYHTAVWTGAEMIVWGGGWEDTYTGGCYNPTTNTWRATSTNKVPKAHGGQAVWTGNEMIVWGGYPQYALNPVNTGGRYNPTTNTWMETPYSTLTGTWQALIYDADNVPQGLLTTTLTASGLCTASLDLSGPDKVRTGRTSFELIPDENKASFTLSFAETKTQLELEIELEVDGDKAELRGSCSIGELIGFRLARDEELPKLMSFYTMLIDHGTHDGIEIPAGMGWATGTISNKGTITISGQLGDAKLIKGSLRLGATGQAIIWLKPYLNKSSKIGGFLSLNDTGLIPTTYLRKKESYLNWNRVQDTKELSYPMGFAPLNATVGVRNYLVPASALSLSQNLGLTDQVIRGVVFDGGGLPDPNAAAKLPESFAIDASYKMVALPLPGQPMAPWTGLIASRTGGFTGTLGMVSNNQGTLTGNAAVSGVLFPTMGSRVVGAGLVKIPIVGPKGAFRTGAILLGTEEQN